MIEVNQQGQYKRVLKKSKSLKLTEGGQKIINQTRGDFCENSEWSYV